MQAVAAHLKAALPNTNQSSAKELNAWRDSSLCGIKQPASTLRLKNSADWCQLA
jgi:hypothetical protein